MLLHQVELNQHYQKNKKHVAQFGRICMALIAAILAAIADGLLGGRWEGGGITGHAGKVESAGPDVGPVGLAGEVDYL